MVAAYALLWGNVAERASLLLIGSSRAPLDALLRCLASNFPHFFSRVLFVTVEVRVTETTRVNIEVDELECGKGSLASSSLSSII
jgi:hypothetical protein